MTHFLVRFSLIALAAPVLAWAHTPSTLDKIKQAGTMTLAYREASIPFSYLDDKAKPTGFGFEICEKWFQSPIPPKRINLNAPMSKELVDNMKVLSDKPAT